MFGRRDVGGDNVYKTSVNLNKIALIRNSRDTTIPNVVEPLRP